MFNLATLYMPNPNQDERFAFWTACMNYIAGNADPSSLTDAKVALGLTSLAFRTTGKTNVTRYLLAQDVNGYQLFMSSNVAWSDLWRGVTPAGLVTGWGGPGKILSYVAYIGNAIFADFFAAFPPDATKKYFVGGHGLCAAMAASIFWNLRDKGYHANQMYGTACPKWANDDALAAFDANCSDVMHMVYSNCDPLGNLPPASIWSEAIPLNGHPRLEPMRMIGDFTYMNENHRPKLTSGQINSRLTWQGQLAAWPDYIAANDAAGGAFEGLQLEHNTIQYLKGCWNKMRVGLQDQCDDLFQVMNNIYTMGLVKKVA